MTNKPKKDFYLVFLGLVIGFALSTLAAPWFISWYAQPPYHLGVDCTPAIGWAMTQLIRWQVAAMLIFSLGFWALSFYFKRKSTLDETNRR